jgi:hypothetical protein
MIRRAPALLLSLTVALSALAVAPGAARAQTRSKAKVVVRAGYGEADATWHVGAGAGQYTAKSPDQLELVGGGDVDPHSHSISQKDSYGVHSRLSYRAIVVQDGQGDQVALVKSDSYLAQDHLSRRVGQILEAEGSAISYDEIFHMASHNHSSPYYQSPSWGVWVFQDAFDLRAFEYHARQMAAAILAAESDLVPARMGATTVTHEAFKGMIAEATVTDDGTPGGYPADFGDLGLSVVRFDDLSNPAAPVPLATLINWGQHPEGLDDHDLITGDFVAPLERFVERATGAPLVFGQGDVGSSERGPGRLDSVPPGIPKRWDHAGHAQGERGAYLLAQDVVEGWRQIGAGAGMVPFSAGFDVEAGNAWVPGPLSHPVPTVSNCRAERTAEGAPTAPGTPSCSTAGSVDQGNMMFENLRAHGIPVPEHYGLPAFTAVEENLRLHLQAFKLGEVLLASCACEAQVDLILNLESRADEQQGNIWDGYDWTERLGCTQAGPGGNWTCRHPRNESSTITFSHARYLRMKAHIHNDAAGWDAPENAATAESEPGDPAKIFGNFTKEELPANLGYKLPIGVGHAGDYNGYTVSYREYVTRDHYRKALTAYGPHTADYMVTRLVRLAGELNGGPELEPEPHDAFAQADEARQVAASAALGAVTSAAYDAWVSSLPDDVAPAIPVTEPHDIRRFDAAHFSWRGGSNAVDNPVVAVERLVDGTWRPFADQSGEVQTMVEFPDGLDGLLGTYQGREEWIWTASFEAFDAFPAGIGSTPAGEYRFVVDGHIRVDGQTVPYRLESSSFRVDPWDGVEVSDLRVEPGAVSFTAESEYPQTYQGSPFPYVAVAVEKDLAGVPFCLTCSFRPWATRGAIVGAAVTVVRAGTGAVEVVPAQLLDGRWTAPVELFPGDTVYVEAGAVVDEYGERNAARSAAVTV